MLAALERHPTIHLSLHYTGPLIEWLERERPAFLERLAALAASGQVELLGGGWYEPVLIALPEPDRLGQLRRMADELERRFGRRPAGAWLAERVWEPDLPTALVDAGYAWTVLDDAHIRAAAVPEEAIWEPRSTEDQGRRLTILGTEQGLRYRIPFRDVEAVIGYLGDLATPDGRRLATMGDDGEKFGGWPTTFEHCWAPGDWVERFFEALEAAADWLTTVTPSSWLATRPAAGRMAIPGGSYPEMGEWALPPSESVAFGEALERARVEGRPEARWLRGAPWRNFQVRYREVNDAHKQMLAASAAVRAMRPGRARDRARDHLYRGQSNDAYWHGLFGGVYLPHLRLATLAELIGAEDATLGPAPGSGVLRDVDLDGRPEVVLATGGQVVVVKPDEGAGIGRWDIRAARHALASVLRRRPEAYHTRPAGAETGGPADPADPASAGVASIHDRAGLGEPGLAERLDYDWHERRSGLIHLFAPEVSPADWARERAPDLAGLPVAAFEVDRRSPRSVDLSAAARVDGAGGPQPIRVASRFRVGGDRLAPSLEQRVRLVNRSDRTLVVRLGLEWTTNLLGGDPAAWWEVGRERTRFDATRTARAVTRLIAGNDHLGLVVRTRLRPSADVWIATLETVSNSEAGSERVHQGSALLVSWLVRLEPGAGVSATIASVVDVAVDRAADERRAGRRAAARRGRERR